MMWKEDKKSFHSLLIFIFTLFFGAIAFLFVISSLSDIEYGSDIYMFSVYQVFIILFILRLKELIERTKHSLLTESVFAIALFSAIFILPLFFISGFSSPENGRSEVLKGILNYYIVILVVLAISTILLDRKQKKEAKSDDNE